MTQGQGETIESLAVMSGCEPAHFSQNLQSRYSEIFADQPSNEVVADRVIEQINTCQAG